MGDRKRGVEKKLRYIKRHITPIMYTSLTEHNPLKSHSSQGSV